MSSPSPRRFEEVKTSMKAYLNDFVDDLFEVLSNNSRASGGCSNCQCSNNSSTQQPLPSQMTPSTYFLSLPTPTQQPPPPPPLSQTPAPTAASSNTVIKTEDEEKPFQCDKCSKPFLSRKSLQKHQYNNHQKGTFRCTAEEGCTFVAKYRRQLLKHKYKEHRTPAQEPVTRKRKGVAGMASNTPSVELKCLKSGCGRVFEQKSQLNRHLREDQHPGGFEFEFAVPSSTPSFTPTSTTISNSGGSIRGGGRSAGSSVHIADSPSLSVTTSIVSSAAVNAPVSQLPAAKPIYRCTWSTCTTHYKSKQKGRVKKHILAEHVGTCATAASVDTSLDTFIEVLEH